MTVCPQLWSWDSRMPRVLGSQAPGLETGLKQTRASFLLFGELEKSPKKGQNIQQPIFNFLRFRPYEDVNARPHPKGAGRGGGEGHSSIGCRLAKRKHVFKEKCLLLMYLGLQAHWPLKRPHRITKLGAELRRFHLGKILGLAKLNLIF